MDNDQTLIDMTAEIVSAYVGNNTVAAEELPELIHEIYGALSDATKGTGLGQRPPGEPAVPIKKSLTADYVTCLEDGQRFKSLKRHLSANHGMTPEEYRARWGLPPDYPMVARNYAKARSQLARDMGLGRKATGRKRAQRKAKAKS